jgi:hypothetical protein
LQPGCQGIGLFAVRFQGKGLFEARLSRDRILWRQLVKGQDSLQSSCACQPVVRDLDVLQEGCQVKGLCAARLSGSYSLHQVVRGTRLLAARLPGVLTICNHIVRGHNSLQPGCQGSGLFVARMSGDRTLCCQIVKGKDSLQPGYQGTGLFAATFSNEGIQGTGLLAARLSGDMTLCNQIVKR